MSHPRPATLFVGLSLALLFAGLGLASCSDKQADSPIQDPAMGASGGVAGKAGAAGAPGKGGTQADGGGAGGTNVDGGGTGGTNVDSGGTGGTEVDSGGTGGIDVDSGGTAGASPEPQPEAGPDAPPLPRPIGASCSIDADCIAGLKCISDKGTELFGGGPSHGLCSLNCAPPNDTACQSYAGTSCVDMSVGTEISLWCVPDCVLHQGNTNCLGRLDLGCTDIGQGKSVCIPICATDLDCPGRICDKRLNVCVDSASAGTGKLGAACDPANDPCEGKCLSLPAGGGAANFCTERCVLGNSTACGLADPDAGLSAGVCFLGSTGIETTGDEAYCAKLCDKPTDCPASNMTCMTSPYGHGFCVPAP